MKAMDLAPLEHFLAGALSDQLVRKNAPGGKISCNRTTVTEAGTGKFARHYFEIKGHINGNDIL